MFNYSHFWTSSSNSIKEKKSKRGKINCSSNELRNTKLLEFNREILIKLSETLEENPLNFYIDYSEQIKIFSELLRISEKNLQLYAGSDDAIKILLNAFSTQCLNLIVQSPNYENYIHYAKLNNMTVWKWNVRENFLFDLTDGFALIEKHPNSLVVITSPNGFTGKIMEQAELLNFIEIARQKNCLIILDQTYAAFTNIHYESLTESFENVLVLTTFSKSFGTAGLRFAYLCATKEIIDYLRIWNGINNISILTFAFAKIYLDKHTFFEKIYEEIQSERDEFIKFISESTPWQAISSETNFVLIKMNELNEGSILSEYLWQRGIVVRSVEKSELSNCIRITMLEASEMNLLKSQIISYLERK